MKESFNPTLLIKADPVHIASRLFELSTQEDTLTNMEGQELRWLMAMDGLYRAKESIDQLKEEYKKETDKIIRGNIKIQLKSLNDKMIDMTQNINTALAINGWDVRIE